MYFVFSFLQKTKQKSPPPPDTNEDIGEDAELAALRAAALMTKKPAERQVRISTTVIKINTSPLANASFFQIGRVKVEICSPTGQGNNSQPLNIKIPTPNPLFRKVKRKN